MTLVPIWAPERWLLIFETKCHWRFGWLIPGRFKHVFAVGYVVAIDTWMVYSVERDNTKIGAWRPGPDFERWLSGVIPRAGVLKIAACRAPMPMPWFSFWCVPAVRHLLGLRSGALWPDQLWRYCLANGAEIVVDADAAASDRGNRTRKGAEARG
ncbi:MAG: hypothetical protein IPK23_15075 [Rhizobiales bacterium]|nr:hypothetical protein [Hyphomicrobiales bacterium]